MLTFIKEYMIGLISLSIFLFFIELIIGKNSLKKYVMLFVSCVMLMQFIKPFKNLFKEEKVDNAATSVYNEITRSLDIGQKEIDINKEVRKQNSKLLKESIEYIKEDIKRVCKENKIICKDIIIFTENDDKVKSMIIKIKTQDESIINVKNILNYIHTTYNIDEKIIKVEEELS